MTRRRRTIGLTVVAAIVLGCAGPSVAPEPSPSPSPPPSPPPPPYARLVPKPPPPPVPVEPPRPWEAVPAGQIALVAAVTGGQTLAGSSCKRDQPLPTPDPPAWGDMPLQSTWASDPARLEPPECVKGWCDEEVVAYPVAGGVSGALLRADPALPALEPLVRTELAGLPATDCPDPVETGGEGEDSPVEDCASWVGPTRAIQVHGQGRIQHNQLPLLERCEARVLRREGDGPWIAGPWAPLEGQFSNLPVPVAQTANQVIWLGDLEAWISTFELEGWTVEQTVGGGIDSGCD